MSCDDDLDIVHKEQENRNRAANARDAAFGAMRGADSARGTAATNRANCGSDHPIGEMIGFCSDEEDALGRAEDDYDDAKGDYDAANDALTEADGWLDLAEEFYCECQRNEADPTDDSGPFEPLDDELPIV